ncbi:MAG: hypothetical protein HC804_14770, partial [Anaerolineae bacterium]|nr:hypothetical protein [Anaerolineae bacterium]
MDNFDGVMRGRGDDLKRHPLITSSPLLLFIFLLLTAVATACRPHPHQPPCHRHPRASPRYWTRPYRPP